MKGKITGGTDAGKNLLSRSCLGRRECFIPEVQLHSTAVAELSNEFYWKKFADPVLLYLSITRTSELQDMSIQQVDEVSYLYSISSRWELYPHPLCLLIFSHEPACWAQQITLHVAVPPPPCNCVTIVSGECRETPLYAIHQATLEEKDILSPRYNLSLEKIIGRNRTNEGINKKPTITSTN